MGDGEIKQLDLTLAKDAMLKFFVFFTIIFFKKHLFPVIPMKERCEGNLLGDSLCHSTERARFVQILDFLLQGVKFNSKEGKKEREKASRQTCFTLKLKAGKEKEAGWCHKPVSGKCPLSF